MEQELMIRNVINTARYFEGYGLTLESLKEVQLVLGCDSSTPDGFTVNMLDIQNMFNRIYGSLWNNALVAKKGTYVDAPINPVIYLDYSPTLENIAKAIYQDMALLIEKDYSMLLTQVVAMSDMGDAILMRVYFYPTLRRVDVLK